jgi:hypothetical protein
MCEDGAAATDEGFFGVANGLGRKATHFPAGQQTINP